jgi:transcription elongation factor Elf1
MEEKKLSKGKVKCPWCDREMLPLITNHKGQSGKIKVVKCSICSSFISSRLEGIPDNIRHSELMKGL